MSTLSHLKSLGLSAPVVLLIGVVSSSIASAQPAGFAAMGVGTASCATFGELMRKGPVNQVETTFFSWAQGYMAGLNEMYSIAGGTMAKVDQLSTDAQKRYLRTFCDQSPLKQYIQGVAELYMSFRISQKLPTDPKKR
jgi:hypothetical protein